MSCVVRLSSTRASPISGGPTGPFTHTVVDPDDVTDGVFSCSIVVFILSNLLLHMETCHRCVTVSSRFITATTFSLSLLRIPSSRHSQYTLTYQPSRCDEAHQPNQYAGIRATLPRFLIWPCFYVLCCRSGYFGQAWRGPTSASRSRRCKLCRTPQGHAPSRTWDSIA